MGTSEGWVVSDLRPAPHRAGRRPGCKCLLALAVEARTPVEPQRGFVLAAGKQHDFVAVLAPRFVQRVCELDPS